MSYAPRVLVLFAFVLSAGTAAATTQNHLDRTAWSAAVGVFEVEDFETMPVGEIACPSGYAFICPEEIVLSTPSFDIVLPAGADVGAGAVAFVDPGAVNGSIHFRSDLHAGVFVDGNSFNTFVFPSAITSFAVDLANVFDFDENCFVDCGPVPFPLTIELAGSPLPSSSAPRSSASRPPRRSAAS